MMKYFTRSLETEIAVELLSNLKPGEMCSYIDLKAALGGDPQAEYYGRVFQARRIVERQAECVLESVRGEGIRRSLPHDVINRGAHDMKSIRMASKRGMRRQVTLVPIERTEGLPESERLKFLATLAHFGLLNNILTRGAAKKIATVAAKQDSPLTAKQTLALFAAPRKSTEKKAE
jgi:hypothetical protein